MAKRQSAVAPVAPSSQRAVTSTVPASPGTAQPVHLRVGAADGGRQRDPGPLGRRARPDGEIEQAARRHQGAAVAPALAQHRLLARSTTPRHGVQPSDGNIPCTSTAVPAVTSTSVTASVSRRASGGVTSTRRSPTSATMHTCVASPSATARRAGGRRGRRRGRAAPLSPVARCRPARSPVATRADASAPQSSAGRSERHRGQIGRPGERHRHRQERRVERREDDREPAGPERDERRDGRRRRGPYRRAPRPTSATGSSPSGAGSAMQWTTSEPAGTVAGRAVHPRLPLVALVVVALDDVPVAAEAELDLARVPGHDGHRASRPARRRRTRTRRPRRPRTREDHDPHDVGRRVPPAAEHDALGPRARGARRGVRHGAVGGDGSVDSGLAVGRADTPRGEHGGLRPGRVRLEGVPPTGR